MAKRITALLLALCLLALLAGCSAFTFQNVNELLRAPALGRGLDEIQNALKVYLEGQAPQYKYPKIGAWRSPLRQADLNGDGRDEAILLYSLPDSAGTAGDRSNNVYVAVLEQQDGAWTVVWDEQGLNTEVASLEVADLLGDGTLQLLVGYAGAGLSTKTLAVYTYQDKALTQAFSQYYSLYLIDDFTGREAGDLIIVSKSDATGGLSMQYVPVEDGRFVAQWPAPVSLDSNMVECVGIVPGKGPDGTRLLVVDGTHENNMLLSQVVYYTGERFYTEDPNPLRGTTGRTNTLLKSRDIDGDGWVEIPMIDEKVRLATPAGKKLELVRWKNFLRAPEAEPTVRQSGLVDSDRSVYIRLPDAWLDEITLADGGSAGEWVLQHSRTKSSLLSLRILETGVAQPLNSVRVPGTASTYLVYHTGLTQAERDIITMTMLS